MSTATAGLPASMAVGSVMCLRGFIWDGSKEGPQLDRVEMVVRADAAAQIQTKWRNGCDGFGDIGRTKTAREKERDADGVTDATAQHPIVSAPGAAKFLDGEIWVAGVEQQGVHVLSRDDSIVHRRRIGHMDDLHQSDPRQLVTQPEINGGRQMVAELQGVRAAAALLRDDGFRRVLAGEKEGGNRRGHGGGNPRNRI